MKRGDVANSQAICPAIGQLLCGQGIVLSLLGAIMGLLGCSRRVENIRFLKKKINKNCVILMSWKRKPRIQDTTQPPQVCG